MLFPFFSNHGVLGLNARSLLYIRPFNPKKVVSFADNKIKTKAFLHARGIPTARLYARIETRNQIHAFDFNQLPNECVLKPNYGFGGEGIMILRGRNKHGHFLRNGKTPITNDELREHIEDILDGKFSVNGQRDTAFFEQILTPHECFKRFRPLGLPDIRVIIFNLVPVMAMVRIPTIASDGKANTHLGGIGIGIDMSKGTTTHAAQYNHIIKVLPHGESPGGHKIPYWDDIMLICSKIQYITNIGYLAVDLTIDQQMGPMLLEVNARAGLMVQLANLAPLRARLERVKGITVSSPEKGVRIGQDLFGQKTNRKQDGQSETPVVGVRETITISLADGTNFEVPALIASDHEHTTFAPELIEELQKRKGVEEKKDTENTFRVKFTLKGKKLQTLVKRQQLEGDAQAFVGRRDLAGFLIDPTKKEEVTERRQTSISTDLRALDRLYAQLDSELSLLKHLKPLNLQEETERLQKDMYYNPVFSYPEIGIDLSEAEEKLQQEVQSDSPLGMLLEKKRIELQQRCTLLRARGNDAEEFTKASVALYGKPTPSLIRAAEDMLNSRIACDLPLPEKELIPIDKAIPLFENVLHQYGLHDWQVVQKDKLVANATVGGKKFLLRSDVQFSRQYIASLIAHEIETHVLTSENGNHQPYAILRRGGAGYLDTQEGLAIYNQNGVISPHSDKRYGPPKNILSLEYSLHHSFAETRNFMIDELGYKQKKALSQSIIMKRGLCNTAEKGGFTKGVAYFRGLLAITSFVENGGDLKRLYVGKIALEDLDLVEKLKGLEPPLIVPTFLREDKKKK